MSPNSRKNLDRGRKGNNFTTFKLNKTLLCVIRVTERAIVASHSLDFYLLSIVVAEARVWSNSLIPLLFLAFLAGALKMLVV